MSAAVREVIDAYPADHEFYGNQLKEDVVKIYPAAVNIYPDTILRMARRHRRYLFCVVDQNKSLYKKLAVKSTFEQLTEQIKETDLKPEPPADPPKQYKQIELSFFTQVFLVVFFGAFLSVVFAFGRPLVPPSFMASKSASVYIPAEPIYIYGFLPYLWSLLFTASDEVSNKVAKYCTVNGFGATGFFTFLSSIYNSLYRLFTADQWGNSKMSKLLDYLLYECIAKTNKFSKFSEISGTTLDYPLGRGYIYIYLSVQTLGHIRNGLRRHRGPKRIQSGSEGEIYERTEKFSGMA